MALGREAARKGLSVREVEARVARMRAPRKEAGGARRDPNTRAAEERLRAALGARVEIARRGRGGQIRVLFAGEAELQQALRAPRPRGPRAIGARLSGMLKMKGFAAEDLNGFLDEGTEFSGELRFRDVLRVDGRVRGKIVSDNTLIIGETGQVDAEIDCGVVSIRGRVTGQVHGRQRIELLSGCRVMATLVSPKLLVEDGAFFQGDCRMGGPPSPASLPRDRGEGSG